MKITIELTGKEKHEDIHKAILNALYGTMANDFYHMYPKTLYEDTDSVTQPELMAIKNEFEQIHAEIEALETEIARIDDELDKTISSMNVDTVRIGCQADELKKIDNKINKLSNIMRVIKSYTSLNSMPNTSSAIDRTLVDISKES